MEANIYPEKTDPYTFSIIMAVYKAEHLLEETLDSLLGQSIGFKQHVQLILVDDGSPDHSGELCDRYAQQYPQNIVVVHKENGGAASARNAGLELAAGRYLNFMDSDDKLAPETLENVYRFFEEHREETDVVAIPIEFFDGAWGSHWQNWKFEEGTRVIDLLKEPQTTNMSVSASFFKAERKGDIRFDSRLVTGEDMKVVLELLYPKLTMGVVKEATYLYRRQQGGSSLVQSSLTKRDWYLNFVPCLVEWAHGFYMDRLGFFPGFVQYTLLCDYQWRIREKKSPSIALSPEETALYREQLFASLTLFEDGYILGQRMIGRIEKLFLLSKKYRRLPKAAYVPEERYLTVEGQHIWRDSNELIYLNFLGLTGCRLQMEGYAYIQGLGEKDLAHVEICVNGAMHKCRPVARDTSLYCIETEVMAAGLPFQAEIDLSLDQDCAVSFFVNINGNLVRRPNVRFSEFCPLSEKLQYSYCAFERCVMTFEKGAIRLAPCTNAAQTGAARERLLCRELWKTCGKPGKKAVAARLLASLARRVFRRKIYLISDRVNKAGDNGEAFYRYLLKKKPKGIRPVYAIAKSSGDYKRMKKLGGRVVPFQGWYYKLYSLLDAVIISSHAEEYIFNPFVRYGVYYADLLYRSPFVFLQHGIIKDDLSDWLNRYQKNLDIFVTSTEPEYQSILEYDYYYDRQVVKLTGLPRFDELYHDERRYITIMPTWRRYLLSGVDPQTGHWSFAGDFTQSTYYKFYNGLLNHPGLLQTAREHGYQLRYLPHPNFIQGNPLMEREGQVEFWDMDVPYREIFAQSNMVVTDYSSAVFDFAYLRKPVLYCQFDREEFFSGEHMYTKGYFEYERDGFGEVVYDLEAAAAKLIEYIRTDCALKPEYAERIDKTFAYRDQDNCKRVFEEIQALQKRPGC